MDFDAPENFRYTKYNKQDHENEHKRDVERNREEKQKSEKMNVLDVGRVIIEADTKN